MCIRDRPKEAQYWVGIVVGLFTILFGAMLFYGCTLMAISVHGSTIPIVGISESFRYLPPVIAGILIILFAIEHLIATFTNTKVVKSWH